MRILFIGDIVGKSGRNAILEKLDGIKSKYMPDFCIANGENSSGGLGMNQKAYTELSNAGIDYFTMGNHTFSKSEISSLLAGGENIVRPANYKDEKPGCGYAVIYTNSGTKIGIVNILGSTYMNDEVENPFLCARALVDKIRESTKCILLDFHAEVTSEKRAMGFFLDGSVSCVFGTHTHVQTADAQILPNGTAYITDVGMTGPEYSVLGLKTELAISRFTTGEKKHYEQSTSPSMLRGVIADINEETGLAEKIITLCE